MSATEILNTPEHLLTERDILIRGASETLMSDPQVGAEMAGCNSAKFVQVARPIYKRNGFDFSDDDLRDIQEMLRELVVRRTMGGKGAVLNVN